MPKTSIKVQYKQRDDWHVFFSDELPGFYCAHKNARKAVRNIVPSLEQLIELDGGVKVKVEIEPSVYDFINMLSRNRGKASRDKKAGTEMLSERR